MKYFKGETSVSYNYALNVAAFTLQGINQVAENLATIGSLSWETKLSMFYQQYVDAYVSLGLNSTHRNTGQAGYINDLLGANNTVCPGVIAPGMVHVPSTPDYCVDKYEAMLVGVDGTGAAFAWSPYENPGTKNPRAIGREQSPASLCEQVQRRRPVH